MSRKRLFGYISLGAGVLLIFFGLMNGLSQSRMIGYFPTPISGSTHAAQQAQPTENQGGEQTAQPEQTATPLPAEEPPQFAVAPWFTPTGGGVLITFTATLPCRVFVLAQDGMEDSPDAQRMRAEGTSVLVYEANQERSVILSVPAGVPLAYYFAFETQGGILLDTVLTMNYTLPVPEAPTVTPSPPATPERTDEEQTPTPSDGPDESDEEEGASTSGQVPPPSR